MCTHPLTHLRSRFLFPLPLSSSSSSLFLSLSLLQYEASMLSDNDLKSLGIVALAHKNAFRRTYPASGMPQQVEILKILLPINLTT